MGKTTKQKVVIFLFISMVLASGGCEPLRKKFVRKKKDDKKAEIIPVLDPEDYPARMQSVESRYRYFYSTWQVWHKELMLELNKKNWKDNRISYDLNRLKIALLEIQQLVVPDKQEVVKQHLASLRKVQDEMQKSFAIRNSYRIKRDMEKLDKKMWKEFRPRVIQDYLDKE